MGESSNLILNKPPKNLEYIQKLLNYDPHTTFLEKAKKWVTQKNQTRPHTISEWCEILGSTKNNTSARSFLENLIKEDALIQEGNKGNPPNQSKTYRLDKKKLEQALYNDPFWNWIRDISIQIINNQEPYKKVKTDIPVQ
jgi:hypothetical protein